MLKKTLIYLLYIILVGGISSFVTPVVLLLVGLNLMMGEINSTFFNCRPNHWPAGSCGQRTLCKMVILENV